MTLWIPATTSILVDWILNQPCCAAATLQVCFSSSCMDLRRYPSSAATIHCITFCKIKYHTLPYSWQLHIDLLQDIWTKSVECSSAFNWCPFASSATWQLHSYNNTVHFAFHCLWFVKLVCFKNPLKNCQKLLFANLWNCADLRKSSTFEPLYRWIGLLQKKIRENVYRKNRAWCVPWISI